MGRRIRSVAGRVRSATARSHWFGADRDCQAWEPGGDDFLSSALTEALCMAPSPAERGFPALVRRVPAGVAEARAGDPVQAGHRQRPQRRQDRASRRPEPQPRLVLARACAAAAPSRARDRAKRRPSASRRQPAAHCGRLYGRALAGELRAARLVACPAEQRAQAAARGCDAAPIAGAAGRPASPAADVAADRLVEGDDVLRGGELGLHHLLLRRIIRPLRVEHGEERVDPRSIARFGERVGVGSRACWRSAGGDLVVDRAAAGRGVGDFAERGLDRLLVGRDRRIALRPRSGERWRDRRRTGRSCRPRRRRRSSRRRRR